MIKAFLLSTRLSSVLSTRFLSHHAYMSSSQLADGVFLRRSLALPPPGRDQHSSLLQGLLLDFERRLSRKIFDVSRTLTALSSELRRSITVENVPNIVLEQAFAGRLSGKSKTQAAGLRPSPDAGPKTLFWRLLRGSPPLQMSFLDSFFEILPSTALPTCVAFLPISPLRGKKSLSPSPFTPLPGLRGSRVTFSRRRPQHRSLLLPTISPDMWRERFAAPTSC